LDIGHQNNNIILNTRVFIIIVLLAGSCANRRNIVESNEPPPPPGGTEGILHYNCDTFNENNEIEISEHTVSKPINFENEAVFFDKVIAKSICDSFVKKHLASVNIVYRITYLTDTQGFVNHLILEDLKNKKETKLLSKLTSKTHTIGYSEQNKVENVKEFYIKFKSLSDCNYYFRN
jgi:hypothetical protein